MIDPKNMITMYVKYGNSKNFFVTLTNSAWTAINLTGATVLFTVKKNAELSETDPTDSKALLEKTITDFDTPRTNGKFTLTLSPEDTAQIGLWDFSYDFKITWSDQSIYNTDIGVISIGKVSTQRNLYPTS